MVMVLAAVTGVYRFQSNRLRIQRQMEIREMQTEHLQEMDRIKSRFFTNISHEFRTPLTLIKGPLQQFLKNESNDNNKSQYKIMLRNTNRLLELVNQILDISKLDSGQMKLQVVETEIASLIKQIVLTFASHAESRKINMKFTCDEEEYNGYIDQDKFTKIITNLISNAFNHTPQDGKININLVRASASQNTQLKRNGLQITVANTGLGIPADQLDRIFDRFYRGSNGYSKDTEGSGIGLALVKELVELHHGRISVKSEISKETVFRIWLPIDQDSYLSEEIDTTYRPSIKFVISEKDTDLRETDFADASVINNNRPQILVVEDNSDVIRYIDHILNDEFRLTSAENGSEGLKLAIKMYPDLILSDVMMPEMDGFEFCRKIKSDERLSHIPVILLTAKADLNSKIEGLEFGADDYLCKPFEADELRTRIRNLIRQRQMLREKFSRMLEVNPAEVTATSLDEQFLDRVINVFENHIADPDMDTVRFARQVGLSRSQLNRKLLALTNQPTSKFLLSLRLKRAAQLIRQYAGNISEIAYMVGFNSLSHFSTKFREQFGESPRQFAKKTKQASTIKD
jgi:DNA-binding response OmpR family regulator/nitrogen-specific signal transduction histidine kinase